MTDITLLNCHEHPLQAVFDKVAKHLLTQNKRAMKDFPGEYPIDRCAYRGDGGAMCAVGCLIPDDVYDPSMEGRSAGEVMRMLHGVRELASVSQALGVSHAMLSALQNAHDNYEPFEWPMELAYIARQYNLSFTMPQGT